MLSWGSLQEDRPPLLLLLLLLPLQRLLVMPILLLVLLLLQRLLVMPLLLLLLLLPLLVSTRLQSILSILECC